VDYTRGHGPNKHGSRPSSFSLFDANQLVTDTTSLKPKSVTCEWRPEASGIDVLVAAWGLLRLKQDIANYLGLRLGPSLIFVPVLHVTVGCEDEMIVSI
jgi:hypothetical protein